jgi:expansin (peptidoglycan-binding protein)
MYGRTLLNKAKANRRYSCRTAEELMALDSMDSVYLNWQSNYSDDQAYGAILGTYLYMYLRLSVVQLMGTRQHPKVYYVYMCRGQVGRPSLQPTFTDYRQGHLQDQLPVLVPDMFVIPHEHSAASFLRGYVRGEVGTYVYWNENSGVA